MTSDHKKKTRAFVGSKAEQVGLKAESESEALMFSGSCFHKRGRNEEDKSRSPMPANLVCDTARILELPDWSD